MVTGVNPVICFHCSTFKGLFVGNGIRLGGVCDCVCVCVGGGGGSLTLSM